MTATAAPFKYDAKNEPNRRLRRHALLTASTIKALPKLGAYADDDSNPMLRVAHVKFFWGSAATFFVTEFDGTESMFGYLIDNGEGAWCYQNITELASLTGNYGIPAVERDCHWSKQTVAEAVGEQTASHGY